MYVNEVLCSYNTDITKHAYAYVHIHVHIYIHIYISSGVVSRNSTKLIRLWRYLDLFGDLQKPPGRGPGQPALGVPAWPGVGAAGLQRALPASALLCFCDIHTGRAW